MFQTLPLLVGIRISSSVNVTVTVLCILSTVVVMHTRQELHVLYIKVHTATRWTIRPSLMLHWFAVLMNVTEEVTVHRPNVSTLLSSAFIRGDLKPRNLHITAHTINKFLVQRWVRLFLLSLLTW